MGLVMYMYIYVGVCFIYTRGVYIYVGESANKTVVENLEEREEGKNKLIKEPGRKEDRIRFPFFLNRSSLPFKEYPFPLPHSKNTHFCKLITNSIFSIYENIYMYNICYYRHRYFSRNRSGWPKSHRRNGSRENTNI